MRKLITIILVLATSVAFGQTTYQLNYDSIRVGKTVGTGATSLYGKTYLKNATEGAPSDSVLTVRNGRVYKIAGSAISSVGFLTYVFSRTASDISGYEQMPALTSYTAGAADTAILAATTTPAIIQEFATNTGFPNTTLIPAGVFNVSYQTQKNSGSNNYYTYVVIYKRSLAGSETVIATTANSTSTSSNTVQSVSVSAIVSSDISMLTTDRIIVKAFGVMVTGTANISLFYDDATDAKLQFPSALVDATNFVPYNGAVKDLVSNYSITGDSIKRVGGTGAQFLMGNGTVQDTTTIQTVSNFFPKGDTRYVKKSGDTMTGTLNGTKINLSDNLLADSVKIIGGTSNQFLKADGSLSGYDDVRLSFGQEYLSFFQNKLLDTLAVKVIYTGDSTTDTVGGYVDPPFYINNLFDKAVKQKGVTNVTIENRAHTGIDSETWYNTYLTGDLAQNPDLYIIRIGLNDPYFGRNASDFETTMRAALTQIRTAKNLKNLSVLLMMPNTASDVANGRDYAWLDSISTILRDLSREFKTGFIDTYNLWQDAVSGGNLYMDSLAVDVSVHPKNVFNTWINDAIVNMAIPESIVRQVSVNPQYSTGASFNGNVAVGTTNLDTYSIGAGHSIATVRGTSSGRLDLIGATGAISFGTPTVRYAGISNQNGDLVLYNNSSGSGLSISENMRLNSAGSLGLGTSTPSGVSGVKNINLYESGSGNSQFIIEGNNGGQFASLLSGTGAGNLPSLMFNNGLRIATATNKDATGYAEIGRFTSTGFSTSGNINTASLTIPTGATNGYVLKSDGSGNATWQADASSLKGAWDASTNTPTLADGVGTLGDYYIVSAGGTQFGRTFVTNGTAVYNGSIWQPTGATSGVTSVNGLTGTPQINPSISGNILSLTGGTSTADLGNISTTGNAGSATNWGSESADFTTSISSANINGFPAFNTTSSRFEYASLANTKTALGLNDGSTLTNSISGNSATSTLSSNSTLWNGLTLFNGSYSSGTIGSIPVFNSTNNRVEFGSNSVIKSWLNLSGTNTGDQTTITGNAGTATALQTARNIQGVSFNGTADINPINGTGFVKATGTTLSYDNSTYLTTSSASSTYAPINSPTFTGTPSLPTGTIAVTQTQGDNSTKIATTAYVDALGGTILGAQKQIANIYTNTSTTGTTTETLFTSNIAQSNLSADGDRIDFNFAGSFGLNANDKFVYLLVGGNTIAVSGNASSKSFWECEGYLLRTSSTTFRLFIRKAVDYVYSSAISDYTVTDFNPLTFSVLGQTNNASFPVTVQIGYLQARKAP